MHQDSSHAAWADTQSEGGGWDDGGQRGAAVQERSASDSAQQQGQRQTDDDDSWAVRETAPASRSAAEGGRASGNFAGFEGMHPYMLHRRFIPLRPLGQPDARGSSARLGYWVGSAASMSAALSSCTDATWDDDEWDSAAPAAAKPAAPVAAARKPAVGPTRAARAGSGALAKKKVDEAPRPADDWGKW